MVQCAGCRHVWLDPRPALESLSVIYPPTYYAYNYAKQIHPIAVRGKAWLDARKLAGIVRYLGRTPRAYLDVGAGDGRFLRAMEARGVSRTLGIRLAHSAAEEPVMPNAGRPIHALPISHVRVEGSGVCLDEQRVYCQRRSRTVSVNECRDCPHFHALRPGVREALA